VSASLRRLARQTLSRVAGAALIGGNTVELLIDGHANFTAWIGAVRKARTSIMLENYIFDDSVVSRELRDALAERAAAGGHVKVIRDWLACLGSLRDHVWKPLRDAGGEVRTYNPFRFGSPFGWLPRDHRKLLVVDPQVGFMDREGRHRRAMLPRGRRALLLLPNLRMVLPCSRSAPSGRTATPSSPARKRESFKEITEN